MKKCNSVIFLFIFLIGFVGLLTMLNVRATDDANIGGMGGDYQGGSQGSGTGGGTGEVLPAPQRQACQVKSSISAKKEGGVPPSFFMWGNHFFRACRIKPRPSPARAQANPSRG